MAHHQKPGNFIAETLYLCLLLSGLYIGFNLMNGYPLENIIRGLAFNIMDLIDWLAGPPEPR